MPLPSLPPQGSTNWYPWAQGVHDAAAAVPDKADASALDGKADLVSGAVPDAQLPARLSDAALRAAFDPSLAFRRMWVPATDRARLGVLGGLTNGTDTGAMARIQHTAQTNIQQLRLKFGNFYNNGGQDTPGPNNITVRAAIEFFQNGPGLGGALVFWSLFFNGSRDGVIQPGATVTTDPAAIRLPRGTTFWIRSYVTVTSGGKWPYGTITGRHGTDAVEQGTSTTDKTTGGTVTTLSSDLIVYGPYAVEALRLDPAEPAVALVGDSILNGSTEYPADSGFAVHALTDLATTRVPFQQVSYPGGHLSDMNGFFDQMRLNYITGCKTAIVSFGTNDLGGTYTLQGMKDQATVLYQKLVDMGMKVFACTIPPRTTSTDSWATTGNQTRAASETDRVAYNEWIRSNPAPLSGHFETADYWETARNSGLWKVNGTANWGTQDGVHPQAPLHIAAAAAINVAMLS